MERAGQEHRGDLLRDVLTGYYGAAMMHGSNINNMFDDNVFAMPTWKDIWVSQ